MKICKSCFKILDKDEFAKSGKKHDGSQIYRNTCKPCHSERVLFDQREKIITKRPDDFHQCDDCCNIFWVKWRYKKCPKCGSENFE